MLPAERRARATTEPLSESRRLRLLGSLLLALLAALTLPVALEAQFNLDLTITPPSPSVVEGGMIAVTVSADPCLGAQNDVTFMVTAEPITAGPSDFGTPNPTTFSIGSTGGFSQAISVPTTDDPNAEPDETFRIRITPLPGQTLFCVEPGDLMPVEATAVATILNDDVVVSTLSIGDSFVTEGDSGTTTMDFLVVLSPPPASTEVVNYTTVDGTAHAGSDYQATQGTLVFAAGQSAQLLSVTVLGDTEVEPDESFFVDVASTLGEVLLGDTRGEGTIRNDDEALPSIAIGDTAVFEGDSGSVAAELVVTLSQPSSGPVTVSFATADGTATAGSDYTAAQGTLTFAPGETMKTVAVNVTGDTAVEADESFFVDLSDPVGATLSDGRGEGTIRNDDATAPTLAIGNTAVFEGDAGTTTAELKVTLAPASELPVTVAYATADGTATAGSDYTAAQGTLTFAPGETMKTVAITVQGDTEVEADETFFVDLSDPDGATVADGRGEGTIRNDDEAPTLPSLTIGDAVVTEGDSGTTTATFAVSLSGPNSSPVTVSFATADGTASAGSDYAPAQGTLSLAPGQTSGQISVTVFGDTAVEPNETFFVNLTGANVPVADAQGRGTIANDDQEPTHQVRPVGDENRNAAGGQTLTLQVQVTSSDGAPATGVVVTWQLSGDATLVGGDTSVSQPPDGIATIQVQLGDNAGAIEVTALLPDGGDPVSFQITVQEPFEALFEQDGPGGSVAGALDAACRQADGEFGDFCEYLLGLESPTAQRQAIEALVPDQVAALANVANASVATQARQLFDRMKRRREGRGSAAGGGGNDVRLNLVGLDVGQTRKAWQRSRAERGRLDRAIDSALTFEQGGAAGLLAKEAPEAGDAAPIELDSRWGLFVSGTISDGKRATTAREQGFDFDTEGLTAGLDYGVNERLSLGAAIGYLSNDTEFSAGGGRMAVDGYSLSAFASYAWQSAYLDVLASFGQNDYELARVVDLPVPFLGQSRFTAVGRPSGDQLGLALALGVDRAYGALTAGGFTRLSWLDSTIDRYRESGGGVTALEIDQQEIESLLAEVGGELTWAASMSWGVLQPQLRVSYLRELKDDSRLLRARFLADRSFTDFAIETDVPDRDFFNAGFGLSAVLPRGWTCYLFYETDFSRQDLDTQALAGGFRVEL
jgi:uncharacterized protein YhjY with autotransporter beta-barrel domain